jgi:23S rRNA pseudouridine1911/1915/1917 synthase
VLAETDDYIVVNKPAPLQIHPGAPNGARTLWHGLCDMLAYEIANGGQVSIINRLDRETSGVVLVAKSAAWARLFGLAMQNRHVTRPTPPSCMARRTGMSSCSMRPSSVPAR